MSALDADTAYHPAEQLQVPAHAGQTQPSSCKGCRWCSSSLGNLEQAVMVQATRLLLERARRASRASTLPKMGADKPQKRTCSASSAASPSSADTMLLQPIRRRMPSATCGSQAPEGTEGTVHYGQRLASQLVAFMQGGPPACC